PLSWNCRAKGNSILFISSGSTEDATETEMLRQLRRAIIERATVRFCYHTRYIRSGQSTQQTREADRYGLVHFATAWHLVAYCHLRRDIRTFRLDKLTLAIAFEMMELEGPQYLDVGSDTVIYFHYGK